MLKKQKGLKTKQITFNEFIDFITNNQGEEIKKQMREIELKRKRKKK